MSVFMTCSPICLADYLNVVLKFYVIVLTLDNKQVVIKFHKVSQVRFFHRAVILLMQ